MCLAGRQTRRARRTRSPILAVLWRGPLIMSRNVDGGEDGLQSGRLTMNRVF
jgi:hypothetical protein